VNWRPWSTLPTTLLLTIAVVLPRYNADMTPQEERRTEAKIRQLDLRAEELQRRLVALEERVSGHPIAFLPWTERVRIQFGKVRFDPVERMKAVEEETALLERWLNTLMARMPQGPIM
jgi:hypothetical protein